MHRRLDQGPALRVELEDRVFASLEAVTAGARFASLEAAIAAARGAGLGATENG